jgi:hypothetical protein
VELKRLGFKGTIDILHCESNGRSTAMEVEAHNQSKPNKAKHVDCHRLEVTLETRILTSSLSVFVGCDSVTQDEKG